MKKKQKKEPQDIKGEVGLIIYTVFFFSMVLILIPTIVYLRFDLKLNIYYSVLGGAYIFIIIVALISSGIATIIAFIESRRGADLNDNYNKSCK